MKIAILIYDGMTALDAVGPYEVLAQLRGAEVSFVGRRQGLVTCDTGALKLLAEKSIDEVPLADVVLVPGGPGDERVRADERLLSWLRAMHAGSRWTASVCTGSLILGAAGVLEGLEATTHWLRLEALADYGAKPVAARFVEAGKVITAAGVSAGIDMALHLAAREAGERVAQAIQLSLEYDPQPPFACGAPQKAPEALVESVSGAFDGIMAERMAKLEQAGS